MRLAAYAGASTALAAGVVVYAFNQRANFYSACVYLAQSNLCLMILTNLILFVIASFMFGLQRMFYGPLRPIEIEQLYEKAWFAVTETCLAMTIFREEVGAWFLVMFVALLAGKVWGWIGEGRVEVLEQQPPTNPRLFHIRLSISLALSLLYDMWILSYTINTVIQQARPNMMVMFLFEFAILTSSSYSTAFRYVISLVDARITKKQTQERLEQRRREVREERAEIVRQRAAAATDGSEMAADLPALPSEDDIDEMDIEVPGWEAKGHWVLTLDLLTDAVKLGIYMSFFFILLTFYGLPIHIMRDMFLTARSFFKRFTAFLRYRRATHDMNQRYPDATVEEIQREDTCIICREEMTPWSVTNPPEPPVDPNAPVQPPAARPRAPRIVNERTRPKKLPCGHVLHLGCLKSWLERQQVCPTCRRPVVDNTHPVGQAARAGQPAPAQAHGQPQLPGVGAPNQAPGPGQQPGIRMRMINLGPIRLGFGQGPIVNGQPFGGEQPAQQNGAPGGPRAFGLQFGVPRVQPPQADATAPTTPANTIQAQIQLMEQQIMNEIRDLQLSQRELQIVQLLQAELSRLREMPGTTTSQLGGSAPHLPAMPPLPNLMPLSASQAPVPNMQRHEALPGIAAIPSGHSDLPPGVTIPEGWTLLPLRRIDRLSSSPNYSQGTASNSAVPFQPAGLQPTPTVTFPGQTSTPQESASTARVSSSIQDDEQQATLRDLDTAQVPAPTTVQTTESLEASAEPTRDSPATFSTSNNLSHIPVLPVPNSSAAPPRSGDAPPLGASLSIPEPVEVSAKSTMHSSHGASSTSNGAASSPSSVTELDKTAEARNDKGKAKATTVEDVPDEDA